MARAHVMRPIIAENGDLLYGALINVREAGVSVPIAQPLYAGPTGDDTLPNPHLASGGVLDFWVETPQRANIQITADGHSDIMVYLDAPPPPEETTRTDTPLVITGVQVPGYVLTAGAVSGEAAWAEPLVDFGIPPRVTALREDFDVGTDPAGWTFTQAATTSRDYTPDAPDGQGYTQSLHAQHTGNAGSLAVVTTGFTLAEPGYVSLWLRPDLAAGEDLEVSVTPQGGAPVVLETLTGIRDWGIYRYPLAADTYDSLTLTFTGAAVFTAGTGHQMWATGIRAVYGGQVPAHAHAGTGPDSVLLGTGATAAGANAIAIGAGAAADADLSIAIGAAAHSALGDSLAIGADAVTDSEQAVAIGAGATGSAAGSRWTVVGELAYADADDATAIGQSAAAWAVGSTAIGQGATVPGVATGATAIGQGAQALAPGSLAVGAGAVVDGAHTGSTAIGDGAATTDAGQLMLGDAASEDLTIIAANRLYGLSDVRLGTTGTDVLGFYGTDGIARPVVTGSDGGVLALRNLIDALAAMGLLTDSTTA